VLGSAMGKEKVSKGGNKVKANLGGGLCHGKGEVWQRRKQGKGNLGGNISEPTHIRCFQCHVTAGGKGVPFVGSACQHALAQLCSLWLSVYWSDDSTTWDHMPASVV
jgi:hypothetical protein